MLIRSLADNGIKSLSTFLRLTCTRRLSSSVKSDESSRDPTASEEASSRLSGDAIKRENAKGHESASSSDESEKEQTMEKPEEQAARQRLDPADTAVFLFPGQGVIKVGQVDQYMHFPTAKDLFEMANETLGFDLLKICQKGPQKKLDETQFNQPATVVTCLAALEKLKEERPSVFPKCKIAAGYSIGEITAAIMSSMISFEDGIKLVKARSTSMLYASTKVPQGMMLVETWPDTNLTQAMKDAISWAETSGIEKPICRIATYLYTEAKVIAGHAGTLSYIQNNQEKYKIKRVKRLPVSGAFHTPLMEPALNAIQNALDPVELYYPRCKVYSNHKLCPLTQKSGKRLILQQVVKPVKWEQMMQKIYSRKEGENFPQTFDIGSNGSMTAILRRINLKAAKSSTVI